MRDMTLGSLMPINAQRESDLRERRKEGHWEWHDVPFLCKFMVCITAALLESFRQRAA